MNGFIYLIMEEQWIFQDCHLLFWKIYIGQVMSSEKEDCTRNPLRQVCMLFQLRGLAFASVILTRNIKILTKTIPTFWLQKKWPFFLWLHRDTFWCHLLRTKMDSEVMEPKQRLGEKGEKTIPIFTVVGSAYDIVLNTGEMLWINVHIYHKLGYNLYDIRCIDYFLYLETYI